MSSFVRYLSGLDSGLVLAPERYDPRRNLSAPGIALAELVVSTRGMIEPAKVDPTGKYLVLDTGDADRGFLLPHNGIVDGNVVGSAKKKVVEGAVLISRLRPYLRQITFAHHSFFDHEATVLCSSEFFVLVSRTSESLAFLVPWLLSDEVQLALAAGQEGGHHPRVREEMLLGLKVPPHILEVRNQVSNVVEDAVGAILSSRKIIDSALSSVPPFSAD